MMFQEARERVIATCIALADKGCLAGTGGNVALRADDEHFLVTPSAVDYYAMGAADICVMRLADVKQVEGDMGASVEAGLHALVLKARPDCAASVHTHQPVASAYTLLDMPLAVKDAAVAGLLGGTIPCVSYAPSGTGWLAKRVGKAFDSDNHACLMRNHGVVCVGKDEAQAMERVAALEAACATFFRDAVKDSGAPASTAALIEKTLASVMEAPNQATTA